jgi:hypothetical protein
MGFWVFLVGVAIFVNHDLIKLIRRRCVVGFQEAAGFGGELMKK